MTNLKISRRIALGKASRETLGSNFGVTERIGLYIPAAGRGDR
jgi:hypothetical protein